DRIEVAAILNLVFEVIVAGIQANEIGTLVELTIIQMHVRLITDRERDTDTRRNSRKVLRVGQVRWLERLIAEIVVRIAVKIGRIRIKRQIFIPQALGVVVEIVEAESGVDDQPLELRAILYI